MKNRHSHARRDLIFGIIVTVVWIACYSGARIVLRDFQLEPWVRVAVALLPILPFMGFLWSVLAHIRSMDEFHRRIHLEALAIAFPLAMLLLMILGLLELAVDLSPDDWSYRHVWAYLPLFYFIGLTIAQRRYQ
jgi:hypothetical protein